MDMHPLGQNLTSFSGTAKHTEEAGMLVHGAEPSTQNEELSTHRQRIFTFHTTRLPLFTFPQQLFP